MSRSLHLIEVVDITVEKKREEEKNTALMGYTDLTNRRYLPSFISDFWRSMMIMNTAATRLNRP